MVIKYKEQRVIITKYLPISEVVAYNGHIRSILYNLISDAIKYSSRERTVKMKVKTQVSGDNILLSVQDNGIGMSSDMHEQIFTTFGGWSQEPERRGRGCR